jgi:hypothetical protein
MPREYAPEIDCLSEGLEIFKDRYHSRLATQRPLHFLTALGAKLWRERQEAAATAEAEEACQNDLEAIVDPLEESSDMPTWTPESVADAIEAMIRHSAHQIRRARWFCLLSESALAWSKNEHSGHKEFLVIFEKGAVVQRDKHDKHIESISPPGHGHSFRTRQNNIDLTTYDRLRVVTTEIRRILAEDRKIALHLGPQVVLSRQELRKALRWV